MVALDLPTLAKSIYSSACPHLAQGLGQLFLTLPTAFPDNNVAYLSGGLMLSVPNFQGAEPSQLLSDLAQNSVHP